jgi:hypothetical protein
MGRKTNPNSFNSLKKIPQLWSFLRSVEYSYLVRKNILLTEIIKHFFEKKGFITKSCFLILHKESNTASLFLSFYILKSKMKYKKKTRRKKKKQKDNISLFFFTKKKGLKKAFNVFKSKGGKRSLIKAFLRKNLKRSSVLKKNVYFEKLNKLNRALFKKIILSSKTGVTQFYLFKNRVVSFKKQFSFLCKLEKKKKKKSNIRRSSIYPRHFFFFSTRF